MLNIFKDLIEAIQEHHHEILEDFNAFWNKITPAAYNVPLDAPVDVDFSRLHLRRLLSQKQQKQQQEPHQEQLHQKRHQARQREVGLQLHQSKHERLYATKLERLRSQVQHDASIKTKVTALLINRDNQVKQDKDTQEVHESMHNNKLAASQQQRSTPIEVSNLRSILKKPAQRSTSKLTSKIATEAQTAAIKLTTDPAPPTDKRHLVDSKSTTSLNLSTTLTATTTSMKHVDRCEPELPLSATQIMQKITEEDQRLANLEKRVNIAKRKSLELLADYDHGEVKEKPRPIKKLKSSAASLAEETEATRVSPALFNYEKNSSPALSSFYRIKMKQVIRSLPSAHLRQAKIISGPDGQEMLNPYWIEIYGE